MAIKNYYKQKLTKGKYEVEYDGESGHIWVRHKTNGPGLYLNSMLIEPNEFKVIKELIEHLDVMQGKK